MKSAVASLVFLFSSLAISCPNLAGTYDLPAMKGNLNVQQHNLTELSIFGFSFVQGRHIQESKYISDGVVREIEIDPGFASSTQSSTCDSDSLIVTTKSEAKNGLVVVSQMSASLSGKNLKITEKETTSGANGEVETTTSTSVYKRQ